VTRLNWKITVATASALLVLALTAAALWAFSAARDSHRWTIHSLEIRAHFRSIRSTVLQAESAERGYLLIHDKMYRDRFEQACAEARNHLRALRGMVGDHPQQLRRVEAIGPLLEAKLTDLKAVLETHDQESADAAVSRVSRLVGERLKQEIFDFLAAAEAEEATYATARLAATERASDVAQTLVAIGGTVALLLAVLTVGFIRRDVEALSRQSTTITRQKDILAERSTDLARSNRDLDQFAYVASHDLKAPLRGIANLATWLEEDLGTDLPPTSKKNLELLRGRVHRLEALIDGILAYSRAGRVDKPPSDVDVRKLVREVVDLAAPPAHVQVDIGALPRLRTDRTALQQVFMNLLGNAIKHGDPTACRVTVSGEAGDGGWIFHVSDNGPGIAPEYHERIFGLFQTLAPRDRVEGSGIGLAVVQKLVEARGGRAWVESQPGQGARFSFTWKESGGSHV
jgi:signal transduction histidine kinase